MLVLDIPTGSLIVTLIFTMLFVGHADPFLTVELRAVIGGLWTETRQAAPLLEPGVFSLGFAEEWEIGVGVLPGGENVLIGDASLGCVSLLLK